MEYVQEPFAELVDDQQINDFQAFLDSAPAFLEDTPVQADNSYRLENGGCDTHPEDSELPVSAGNVNGNPNWWSGQTGYMSNPYDTNTYDAAGSTISPQCLNANHDEDAMQWEGSMFEDWNSGAALHASAFPETGVPVAAEESREKSTEQEPASEPIQLLKTQTLESVSVPERTGSASRPSVTTKRRPRIPEEAKVVLLEYFKHTPYPSAWEYDVLAHQTKLDVKRIRTWFNNARVRRNDHDVEQMYCDSNGEVARQLRPRLSKESLDRLEQEVPSTQAPLQAWMASSADPVSASVIEAASADPSSNQSFTYRLPQDPNSLPLETGASVYSSRAASSASSAASRMSKYSISSLGSNRSSFSRSSRQGKKRIQAVRQEPYRKPSRVIKDPASRVPAPEKSFFCTFCERNGFKTKYEWARHEESMHVPTETWICCPLQETNFVKCPFCDAESPTDDHLAKHKYFACGARSEEDRTFYRRDQFIQHLHRRHLDGKKHPNAVSGCMKGSPYGCEELVEQWRRPAQPLMGNDPALHCGFCGEWFLTWEGRSDHVAHHMSTEGMEPVEWWPARLPNTLRDIACSAVGEYEKRCRYCGVDDFTVPTHLTCSVWSCRFRPYRELLCTVTSNGSYDYSMAPAELFEECTQQFYPSRDEFIRHLQKSHGISTYPFSSTFLSPSTIDNNYLCMKLAVFAPELFDGGFCVPRVMEEGQYPAPQTPQLPPTDPEALPLSSPAEIQLGEDVLAGPTAISWPLPPVSQDKSQPTAPPLIADPSSPELNLVTVPIPTDFPPLARVRPAGESTVALAPQRRTFRNVSRALNPPRFLVPSQSFSHDLPILWYLRSGRAADRANSPSWLRMEGATEIEKGHIATLVLSSGLMGMASQGLEVGVYGRDGSGWIGLGPPS